MYCPALLVFLACQFEYEWYSIADYEHSKTCEHKMRIRFKAKDYNPTKKEMLSYRVYKYDYYKVDDNHIFFLVFRIDVDILLLF